MGEFIVDKIKDADRVYFFIRTEDMLIVEEPSKFLKFKMLSHSSPNTLRRLAYAMSYYFKFLHERQIDIEVVLHMKYADQYEHFEEYLQWLSAGLHTKRANRPRNSTCNSYLQLVFEFYEFLSRQYQKENLKVLEDRVVGYSSSAGVRFRKNIKTFRGYLPAEESKGRTIEKENIICLLKACENIRDKLLILILAETGLRIGEILGIRYGRDIDYDTKSLCVVFREDNSNEARAKNAEYRKAKISNETYDLLMIYITENRKLLQKSEYLFVNMHGDNIGTPLKAQAVYSVFRTLEKRCGIKVTPHMLRHFFANERRKAGWSLDKISAALGHRHLNTTEKYMNIEDEEMENAMNTYFTKTESLFDIRKVI